MYNQSKTTKETKCKYLHKSLKLKYFIALKINLENVDNMYIYIRYII